MINNFDNNPPYIDIYFDENNEPLFKMGESVIFDNEGVTDIANLKLNITSFGKADRIIIATTLSPDQRKHRWLLINNQWYKVSTPTFWLRINPQSDAILYDAADNPVNPILTGMEGKDHEEMISIDHLSFLEAFGSHHELIKWRGRWRLR